MSKLTYEHVIADYRSLSFMLKGTSQAFKSLYRIYLKFDFINVNVFSCGTLICNHV